MITFRLTSLVQYSGLGQETSCTTGSSSRRARVAQEPAAEDLCRTLRNHRFPNTLEKEMHGIHCTSFVRF